MDLLLSVDIKKYVKSDVWALHYWTNTLKHRDVKTHKHMAIVIAGASWGQDYLHIASLTTDRAAATSPACSSLRDWSNRDSASNTQRSKPSPFPAGDKQHSTALSAGKPAHLHLSYSHTHHTRAVPSSQRFSHSRNPRNASGDRSAPFTLTLQAHALPWFWSSSRSINLLGLGLKPMAASFSFSFRLCNSCSLARRATSSWSSSSSLRPSPAARKHKQQNIKETVCHDL